MLYLYARITNWFHGQEGQDLIEYALLAGLIAVAAVAAIVTAGEAVDNLWTAVTGALGTATDALN